MIRDPLHAQLHNASNPVGPSLRCRLIPALNPCWRLWLREEGPLELVCLAQIALELWSVQTDGTDYYFCHNRLVRKVWIGCVPSLRRDIGSVRGGFVREVRVHLGEPAASTAWFGRERAVRAEVSPSANVAASPVHVSDPASVAPVLELAPESDELVRTRGAAVQVSYRRRRHVALPTPAALHA